MRAEHAILELAGRFDIEAPHTRHVTRLALELFHGFSDGCGLKADDRNLLYAAASLHDIAYASDPENHVVEGARLLAANRIEKFDAGEWNVIIGIVLLHKRDWRSMLNHELFPVVGDKDLQRIKKLAAFLRIADGLDHGHIQDARIMYCKRGKQADKVGVKCKWYAGNILWAEGKADLWEAVYKRPFRIEGKLKAHNKPFRNVVHKKDSALSAGRRIMYSQWCIMRDQVPGMRAGDGPECLHRYRVALRRFRAALRLFRPMLEDAGSAELDRRLKEMSDALSPIRDAHVALETWRRINPDEERFPHMTGRLESEVAAANKLLISILDADACLEKVQLVSRFLRVELPRLERQQSGPPFPGFAQEGMESMIAGIQALDVSGLRSADPAALHRVRKRCRRGRYYAEFAAPVLGGQAQQFAKTLKAVAAALGDVRDLRSMAAALTEPDIAAMLADAESVAWTCFDHEWNTFTNRCKQLQ